MPEGRQSPGRQSPAPESQSDRQVGSPERPAYAAHQSPEQSAKQRRASAAQLEGKCLESNPRSPMDDVLKSKFHKGTGN